LRAEYLDLAVLGYLESSVENFLSGTSSSGLTAAELLLLLRKRLWKPPEP
jgi:hypothetical protein